MIIKMNMAPLYGLITITTLCGGGHVDWNGGYPPIIGQDSNPFGTYHYDASKDVPKNKAPAPSDIPQIVPWFLTT